MSVSSAAVESYAEPPDLDHIVHLVDPGKLKECIALYEKLGFSVERGGVHADGLTQNALIVLTDGVYVELVEFLEKPPKGSAGKETLGEWKERRRKHWWWGKKEGWIDWCLRGGVKDGRAESINQASQLAMNKEQEKDGSDASADLVRYNEKVEGGRTALSGRIIKWNVTFPHGSSEVRGMYPFWCEDVTPRWWRVPTPAPHHPNLTKGLAALTLLYYPETFPSRLASLQLILSSAKAAAEDMQASLIDLDTPPVVEGSSALPTEPIELYLSTPDGPLLPVRIKAAEDPDELQWLKEYGEGLWEVEISVASDKLPPTAPPDGIERDSYGRGYGRLRLHPINGLARLP